MNNDDALIILVCVVLPILILIAVIVVIYFAIEHQDTPPKVEPISPKTDYCKLHKQYCYMDIIMFRYEHTSVLGIAYFDYRLFKMEVDNVFSTPDERKVFFEKYPDMKQRYQCLEYFLWRMSSHR